MSEKDRVADMVERLTGQRPVRGEMMNDVLGRTTDAVEGLEARIKQLEKAAWRVIEEVDPPRPGDYYYREEEWVALEALKQALLGEP